MIVIMAVKTFEMPYTTFSISLHVRSLSYEEAVKNIISFKDCTFTYFLLLKNIFVHFLLRFNPKLSKNTNFASMRLLEILGEKPLFELEVWNFQQRYTIDRPYVIAANYVIFDGVRKAMSKIGQVFHVILCIALYCVQTLDFWNLNYTVFEINQWINTRSSSHLSNKIKKTPYC